MGSSFGCFLSNYFVVAVAWSAFIKWLGEPIQEQGLEGMVQGEGSRGDQVSST